MKFYKTDKRLLKSKAYVIQTKIVQNIYIVFRIINTVIHFAIHRTQYVL